MIRFEQVTKSFGPHKAVDDLSLSVASGETMILLGTSGCGKTTTLRMANRLISPTSGAVFIDDKNVADQPPELLRRGIGYVLQHNSLFPHYTVAQNIAIVPKLQEWPEQRIRARITELLDQMHLPQETKHQYPAQLSGGQQQRVNVARALAADPAILLMDEPFGALDPVTRASVRKDFTGLEALQRKTILMVTHDVEEAFELGDRISLMHGGRILQTGRPVELLFRPEHELVRDFLSGQFLSLALKSVRLSDVLLFIPWESRDLLLADQDPEQTIWNIMAKAGAEKTRDAEELVAAVMAAFYRYQQQFN